MGDISTREAIMGSTTNISAAIGIDVRRAHGGIDAATRDLLDGAQERPRITRCNW
jgi:hypothetical protein